MTPILLILFITLWAVIGLETLLEFESNKGNKKIPRSFKVIGKAAFYGPFTAAKVLSKLQ